MELLTGALSLAGLGAGSALWLQASRPLRHGGAAERFLDGMLVLCWLGVAHFFLLAGFGWFRVWIAVPLWIVTGWVAVRAGARDRSAADRAGADALSPPDLRDPFLWFGLPLVAIALVRLLKSLIAPPMAWDAMTMHLPKAAFWIQSGSLALPDFPDAWTYYRWFPGGGEILFAWVMLPVRGDLLLGAFGFLIWIAIWIAGARLAKVLGAPDGNAWLAGAALAALPAALVFMSANYVDNLAVLFVLIALTHAISFARSGESRSSLLGCAAAGLAIAVKTSSLVLAFPLVLALAGAAWRRRTPNRSRSRSRGTAAAVASIGALALPCFGYLQTWIETGSPLFPVRAPGLPLPYHQGLADLFSGRAFGLAALADPGWPAFLKLFYSAADEGGHLNFGLGGAILAAAGTAGFLYAASKPGRRSELALCLAGAVLLVPLVLSPGNLGLRTLWIGVLGRHLLPALAPLALCAALLPDRFARPALIASLTGSAFHFLPLGWSGAMTEPALRLGSVIAGLALAAWLARKFLGTALGPRPRLGLGALAVVLLLAAWTSIRESARYPIYRETTRDLGAFDAHPIHPTFAMAASLWERLDSPETKRIAVAIGPDQVGHNQFFYPLLGSRLQNRLLHVATSNDPSDLDRSARERYGRAQPEVWLANLETLEPDRIVGLWQLTPEREWLAAQPSFEVAALTDLGVPWIAKRRTATP